VRQPDIQSSRPGAAQVAYRLSLHSYKSFQTFNNNTKVFTAPLHVEAWANYTLSALESCRGKPSVVFPTTLLASRYIYYVVADEH
jgi:hypothetical protein